MADDPVGATLLRLANLPDAGLAPDTPLGEVPGWDSLSFVNLVYQLESEYGIHFDDGELDLLREQETVGGLSQAVAGKLAATLA